MATTATKWFVGCGIGCIVMIFLLAGLAGGGFLCVRGMVRGFQAVEESQEALIAEYGSIADYFPSADGSIEGDRISRFISVRQALIPHQKRLEMKFDRIARHGHEQEKTVTKILQTIRGFSSIAPAIASYIEARNSTLLEQSMGIGEYIYLYMIIYHSWFGNEPDDHPDIDNFIIHSEESGNGDGSDFNTNFDSEEIQQRYRLLSVRFLENQIHAAESMRERQDPAWIASLDDEVHSLKEGIHVKLWQNGLPLRIRSSIEPYRTKLEQTYSATSNVFDIFFNDFDRNSDNETSTRL